ncbi:carbon-nitrogen hydrolase family protein [Actinocorallia sp. A-T 12471]|uniref:carbon-nitrogen hydrolase family protein n=1 Tax=Actinocorallia sp. A-T 12471 TaxID=3089813 RepID=UPI0029CC2D7B|nr:carbon-nitrogen hydrolase family protein [Actinocorallia sp. A-T 12471]MDX6743100.1 carbon-nitrogen hydrolase family protein [Actinocorallia sp. A-T 12471]
MRAALCQIDVTDDPAANLAAVRTALDEAAGADLAIFPEATLIRFGNSLKPFAEPLDGPFVTALRAEAAARGVAVIAGTFEPSDDGRVHNTVVAIDAAGAIAGTYRKIHLFDAFAYKESATVAAGDEPVVVELAGARIGLITCYDIRFPELARALVDRGAELLVVTAAWAQGPFKEEHWTTLVRARAIENTLWTLAVDRAPDLTDPPRGARTGVGRSLAVDPMGTITADLGPFPAVRTVPVDLSLTARVRSVLPSLTHRRL